LDHEIPFKVFSPGFKSRGVFSAAVNRKKGIANTVNKIKGVKSGINTLNLTGVSSSWIIHTEKAWDHAKLAWAKRVPGDEDVVRQSRVQGIKQELMNRHDRHPHH
jgi:hypothetical protein